MATKVIKPKFIVAEVSKVYIDGESPRDSPLPNIAAGFEEIINVNSERGYDLVDWRLISTFGTVPLPAQVYGNGAGNSANLTETIVAVFQLRGSPA